MVDISVGIFIWVRIRKLKDTWGLSNESFWSIAFSVFAIFFYLLETFVITAGYLFSFNYFIPIFLCLLLCEQSLVQLYLGRKKQPKPITSESSSAYSSAETDGKDRKTAITSTNRLQFILDDPILSKEFEEHLKNEFGLESLLFLKDVEAWKKGFYDINENTRKGRAKKIFKLYVDSRGVLSINVSSQSVEEIKVGLEKHEKVSNTIFDHAVAEVKELMNIGACARFLKAKKYTDKKKNLHQISNASPDL